ncbi:MAG TPA: hypothetical protein VMS98_06040 [Thermoanaerobaculia bacterium]|nr:hypothetical protein [Thermoanaerobaculia bacterium]
MNADRLRLAIFLIVIAFSTSILSAAIATSAMNIDGVNIDVTAVERKGSVLTLKFAVKNSGTKTATVQFALTGDKVTTYLVDEESGTKYYVLTDKEGNSLATEHDYTGSSYGISEYVEAGATKRFWAKFPAPPAAVKTINIMFSQAEPVEDAPITDKK